MILKNDKLSEIQLGASFSPEHSENLGCSDPLDLLKIIVKDLKLKDIRIGLRWNKVDNPKGNISLKYYYKYLDYLLKQNCNICINVGPIKTFRWPEQHIPERFRNNSQKVVSLDSKLASESIKYVENLLILLKKQYYHNLDSATFQVENEAFNSFGVDPLVMSSQYLQSLAELLLRYFPKAKLLFNSAGRRDFKNIVNLFKSFYKKLNILPENLILGLDYYYALPQFYKFFKRFDPLKFSFPWDMTLDKLHKHQKFSEFKLEVTEAQFEPWGIQKTPGNSFSDFEFLIKKCSKFFPENYSNKLIRLWGVEEFALKIFKNELTVEHKKIISQIHHLNKKYY